MGIFRSKKSKDKPKPKITYEDNYIGNVEGNLLDAYQNTSYNLKLYMIPAKTGYDNGGWMRGAMAAQPRDTIVIAQTSVTGVQIDNLDISFVQGPGTGNSVATRAQFTLIQPGAADLLDQIQIAKAHLGHYMYADVPMFLAIEFKGYQEDIDDEDAGGAPAHITGPFIFQLRLAKVSVAIDDTGSQYEFDCPVAQSEAYADYNFKIPKDMYVQGQTIEEITQNLQENIKKFKEDNLKEEEIHDEILFDLSQLQNVLTNTSIVDGSNRGNRKNAEQVNRLINAESKGIKTKEDFEKALEDNPDSLDGGISIESGGFGTDQQINMKEGTSMNQFFTTALVMCDSFLNSTTRKSNFRDPSLSEDGLDLDKTFVKWYRIEADIEYMEFDSRRNKYAKRITYKPIVYNTRQNGQNTSAAEEDLSKEQVTNIIKNVNIKKAYHYLYTGLNDQILSADIQYNAGQVLLQAPGAGTLGDLSTNANKSGANIDGDSDLTGKAEKERIAAEQSVLLDQISKGDTEFNRKLKDDLRMTDKEYEEFVEDKSRTNATAKALAHANYTPGYSRTTNNGTQDVGDYKPEGSGYIYSVDLLDDQGGSETVIGNTASASDRKRRQQMVANAANGKSPEARTKRMVGQSIVSTSGDTSDGTNAATLFGYMYQNVNDSSILVELGLKVRGDPFYLGVPNSYSEAMKGKKKMTAIEEYDQREESSKSGMVYNNGDDNFFLFTMQTPRVRDPNIDDEDENPGYLKSMGTAFFISGVYRIVSTTCSFSGGMYTVNFDKAPKDTALHISKFNLTDVDYGDEGETPMTDEEIARMVEESNARQQADFEANRGNP
tara:strand:- start:21595 stop:24084 length:2490 start_codon:yes stop_codon:yes gene_type:complete